MFATAADVEAILGRTLDAEATTRVERLLTLASGLVSAIMGYTVDPNPIPALVTTITANAVVRVMANPTGAQSQTAGPFSETFGPSEPGLGLTVDEVAQLRQLRAGRQALYTIQTTRGDDNLTRYVQTDIGGDLVPFETIEETW